MFRAIIASKLVKVGNNCIGGRVIAVLRFDKVGVF
jgi:hypothetical protein